MLKRKLQYFGHQMRRTDSLEKTLMLGKTEGRRRRGQQRTRWLDGITDSMDKSLSRLGKWWGTRRPGVLQSMGSQRIGHSGWITTTNSLKGFPGDSMVKNLSMQETRLQLLGQEDPLEEETATHSSIHAWRIPWTEEPGGPQSTRSQSQTWLGDSAWALANPH